MRSNLIPTTVTDKNGKVTTVHRRDAPVSAAKSVLAGVKPSISQTKVVSRTSKADAKTMTVKLNPKVVGRPGSFLHKFGVTPESLGNVDSMTIEITQGEAFEYLKLGIGETSAALLNHVGGSAARWMEDDEFREAMPTGVAVIQQKDGHRKVSVEGVVDLARSEGLTYKKTAKLLSQGLNDEHIEKSVLSNDDLIALFSRFSYQHSIDPNGSTNSAATVDALNEGRLPAELIYRKDADKSAMTTVLYALYPPSGKRLTSISSDARTLTEDDREELLNDPEKVTQVVRILSRFSNSSNGERLADISTILKSINKFGFESSYQHHPGLLLHKMSDGAEMGVERVNKVRDCVGELVNLKVDGEELVQHYQGALSIQSFYKGTKRLKVYYSDVAEFQLMGKAPQEIHDLTYGASMDSNRALAIAQNKVIPVVSDGWL